MQTTPDIGHDLETIDGRFEARYERGALVVRAPDWTEAQAVRCALLTYALDGHDGAIGYAQDGAEYCTACADKLASHTPALTMAQDAAIAGLDFTREHAGAILDGTEYDTIPVCDACGAPIDRVRLIDVDGERRAYIAVHVQIERGKRAGCEPSAPQEDMQATRAAVLERHGVDVWALDRAARIADRRALARELAEGWR